MNYLPILPFLALGFAIPGASAAAAATPLDRRQAANACAGLKAPTVPGAQVVSITAAERRNLTVPISPVPFAPPVSTAVLSYCDVNVTLTHGSSNDRVRIQVWLPLDGWNGRYQATGGAAFLAGTFDQSLAPAVAAGYAAASTDAGLPMTLDGNVTAGDVPPGGTNNVIATNPQLVLNFASLSYHEMAIVGKALTESFYGRPPNFSYWNGCSTGGRQGMQEAQMYPDDFDGILAAAPAINWGKFVPANVWPFVVMTQEGEFPAQCVFETFIKAHIDACDNDDGARDNVISAPGTCKFNPQSIVGRPANCTGNGPSGPLTARQATIYGKIIDGVRAPDGSFVWYGLTPGAPFSSLAQPEPFPAAAVWVKDFVLGQHNYNLSTFTYQNFPGVIAQSQEKFGKIIGTDNPDLSAFKKAGGKLLSWHGLSDNLIYPNGTFDYYQRVEKALGGTAAVESFYRVFAAPGVLHCGGGDGATPTAPFDALVAWVEQGKAPETLAAANMIGTRTITRNLCRFPAVQRYKGSGSIDAAENWICEGAGEGTPVPASASFATASIYRAAALAGLIALIIGS